MRTSRKLDMVFLLISIALFMSCIVLMGLLSIKASMPEEQSAISVKELRSIVKACESQEGRYPSIETVWNAPVGQPRKPIKWIVTCEKMENE